MLHAIIDLLEGFWTWQTPMSFLAGIGVNHLFVKYYRDRKDKPAMMMYRKKNGTEYYFTIQFWVVVTVATLVIGFIGWRTQDTANKVEDQAASTAQFANDTNDCLVDVVAVLTTRVGYNEQIAVLDARRQSIWDKLVDDLASADNSQGLNMDALARFRVANTALKADQAKLIAQRDDNTYPECPSSLAKSPGE